MSPVPPAAPPLACPSAHHTLGATLLPTHAAKVCTACTAATSARPPARSLFLPRYAYPPFYLGGYYGVPSSHVLRALAVDQFYCAGGAAAGCQQITVASSGLPASLIAASTPTGTAGYVSVDRYTFVADTLQTDYGRRWFEVSARGGVDRTAVGQGRRRACEQDAVGPQEEHGQCILPLLCIARFPASLPCSRHSYSGAWRR
jgi:hypothetical protein